MIVFVSSKLHTKTEVIIDLSNKPKEHWNVIRELKLNVLVDPYKCLELFKFSKQYVHQSMWKNDRKEPDKTIKIFGFTVIFFYKDSIKLLQQQKDKQTKT